MVYLRRECGYGIVPRRSYRSGRGHVHDNRQVRQGDCDLRRHSKRKDRRQLHLYRRQRRNADRGDGRQRRHAPAQRDCVRRQRDHLLGISGREHCYGQPDGTCQRFVLRRHEYRRQDGDQSGRYQSDRCVYFSRLEVFALNSSYEEPVIVSLQLRSNFSS